MSVGPSSVGERILADLKRLGWDQEDLARVLGKPRPAVNLLVKGKRGVTPEVARGLAAALGGTPKEWLELEAERQLNLIPTDDPDVSRRAELYRLAPVKEMERRGWIRETGSAAELEGELRRFFGTDTVNDEAVAISAAARKTNVTDPFTASQRAWLYRARQLAQAPPSANFDPSPSKMSSLAKSLRDLAAYSDEAHKVSRVFSERGIRFVIVEPLAGGAIDGAAFWLDEESPVIAVSLRIDRMDAFWFTVAHEFSHIRNRDAYSLDVNLVGPDQAVTALKDEVEQRADQEAADMLVPTDALDSFVSRVGPMYPRERIVQFAHRIKMHPGIILGQLQHRGEVPYSRHRVLLKRIRERATAAAICDGWGRSINTL